MVHVCMLIYIAGPELSNILDMLNSEIATWSENSQHLQVFCLHLVKSSDNKKPIYGVLISSPCIMHGLTKRTLLVAKWLLRGAT